MTDIDQVLNQNLTPRQRGAAKDSASEVLCLACAGSGKSRTLAFRIARLIADGEDPSGIVAFTFTDKASEAIKRQVAKALTAASLDPMILGAMYIGTIHSYCHSILCEIDAKYRQFDILDDNRLKLFLMSRYPQLRLKELRNEKRAKYFITIKEVSEAWKIINDELIEIGDINSRDPVLARTLGQIRAKLNEDQFIDFSLMIRLVVEALQQKDPNALRAISKLKHLMVDEYQDVNPSQEMLISQLHLHSSTLFVVGDDDQSIYSWRGADVNNILSFAERYSHCSPHTLSCNFRSTPAIVAVAEKLAQEELVATRIPKNPEAFEPLGSRDLRSLWFPNRNDEANWIAEQIRVLLGTTYPEGSGDTRGLTQGDFAILMRSTGTKERDGSPHHRAYTHALNASEIYFSLEAGGGIFDRPQVRVLRNTFELLRDIHIDRNIAQVHFDHEVLPAFPFANFDQFTRVLTEWSRLLHAPAGGSRRRVFPQKLVHELLSAFQIKSSNFDPGTMQDIGVFSRIMQDVESVYLSIDSTQRFADILNFLQHVAESGYDTGTHEVLLRPDLVTVSTVHKVKGLEYPVVFVVDVEAERFPLNEKQYKGWLPAEVIRPALERGAYKSTHNEEARLFYTALTRAERYLYVTGSQKLPGGKRNRKPSGFSLRLEHSELSNDQNRLTSDLTYCTSKPRIEDITIPTSYSDIRYYLSCPRDYQFRKSFGFSPAIKEMFGFGKSAHTVICKLHEAYSEHAPSIEETQRISDETFHLKHVASSREPEHRPGPYERAKDSVREIAQVYVENYAEDFSRNRQIEARFEIPLDNAIVSGSIDLLLKMDEMGNVLDAIVVDFKAIEGQDIERNERLHWTELALQVQLYAMAAQRILGENARTGAVHLLKDNQRIDVPVDDEALRAAIENVEWAVDRILKGDFPMRPHQAKCASCDFSALCSRVPEEFATNEYPPQIHIPGEASLQMARAFSEFGSIR